MKLFRLFAVACMLLAGVPELHAQQPADRIVGIYYVIEPDSKEESKIQIYKSEDGKYHGKVIWMKEPDLADGTPKRDIHNPNPKLRNVRADRLVLMRNFTYNPKSGEWVNGEIYNPVDGSTYKCKLAFESEKKLKVRGYVGIPALGRSMYWTKMK